MADLGFPVGLEYTKGFLNAKLLCVYVALTQGLSMIVMGFGDVPTSWWTSTPFDRGN